MSKIVKQTCSSVARQSFGTGFRLSFIAPSIHSGTSPAVRRGGGSQYDGPRQSFETGFILSLVTPSIHPGMIWGGGVSP